MSSEVEGLAERVGCHASTLWLWIRQETLRRDPTSPEFKLAPGEADYVVAQGALLLQIKQVLRTTANMSMVVLHGTHATGTGALGGPIELVVVLQKPNERSASRLETRVSEATGRPVRVVTIDEAERSPSLMRSLAETGRPLTDRRRGWPELQIRANALSGGESPPARGGGATEATPPQRD